MTDDELESFMNSIVAAIDRQIMDRVCRRFSPSFFCRDEGGEVSVALLETYPESEDRKREDMAAIAEQAAKMGLKPEACGMAAMFLSEPIPDVQQVTLMLVATMSPDGKTRQSLMVIEADEEGVLSIREKYLIPNENQYEIFDGLGRMLSYFYSSLKGRASPRGLP
jgi:hypothetical protein